MRSLFFLGLLYPQVLLADLQAGNWRITANTSINDAEPNASVLERCISNEDARDPTRIFGSGGSLCEFSNRNDDGALYTFDVSCGLQPAMRGKGRVEYTGTMFEADLDLSTQAGGQSIVTRSHLSGRRLGGC